MEGEGALKLKAYDAYIFDLDGTLFAIPVDWVLVRRELSEAAGEKMDGAPLFPKLQEVISGRPALRGRLFSIIDTQELKAAIEARAMPGASELLYSLFEAGRLALVTMQGKRACEQIIQKFKFTDLFETVITREDSIDRAEQLRVALNRLGVQPDTALFAGDRLNDVASARKVGVDVALVGREAEGDLRPDYSFRDLVELKASIT